MKHRPAYTETVMLVKYAVHSENNLKVSLILELGRHDIGNIIKHNLDLGIRQTGYWKHNKNIFYLYW